MTRDLAMPPEPRTILVAEDDPNIREGLVDTLEGEGYRVLTASDGEEALERIRRGSGIDLVLLDLMMPGRNGYEVCREIRRGDERTAIIMLTAKGEEIDKVLGLQLGADDYVTKPFGVRELVARVSAVLRRSASEEVGEAGADSARFAFGDAEVDPLRFEARIGERVQSLTEREMLLIALFRRRPDQVLSRSYLLDQAWGIEYMGTTRTLDQHIAQLRKKIEPEPRAPRSIVTVHGIGYRYRPRR